MKTIQISIDEDLLAQVNDAVALMGGSRSRFIRDALTLAVKRYALKEMEVRHAQGYADHPVLPGEFDAWEAEQVWHDT